MKLFLYFLLFISIVYGCDQTCVNGACNTEKNICECRLFWSGSACEKSWLDNKTYGALFWLYTAYTILLQSICLFISISQLHIMLKENKKNIYTLPGCIVSLCLFASVLRIVNFAVDPHSVRNIIGYEAVSWMFNFPYILWLIGGFMLYLYWIEIQTTLYVRKAPFITKYRPLLLVFVVFVSAFITIMDIAFQITVIAILHTIFNIFLLLMYLLLVFMISLSGYKLRKRMNRIYWTSGHPAHLKFVTRITKYILAMDVLLILTVLCLIISTIVGNADPNFVIITYTIYRSEEFGMVFITLLFISRKKPQETTSSEGSSTSPLSSTAINSNSDTSKINL